jgi:hypothetical protein
MVDSFVQFREGVTISKYIIIVEKPPKGKEGEFSDFGEALRAAHLAGRT